MFLAVIKDVAKLAGVSTSTVSKYLNNPNSLKEINRNAVEDAIQKLNYKPNLFARNLRVQSSRTIAVIAQEITNPFHATIYNTIRKEAQKEKYSVILYSINDIDGNINSLFESMPISYLSGIIVCYFHDMDKSIDFAISNKNFPFVIMSNDENYLEDENYKIVYGDFASGMSDVTKHLLELGKKKIAYVGCMTRRPEREPKFKNFMKVMNEYGLQPHSVTRLQKEYNTETGYESAKIILSMQERPDAILVDNDIMAMGVLRCLADYNVKVPDDVLVTGFDDIIMASVYCPALTTVHVPIEEMSIEAFRLILAQINKEPIIEEAPKFIPHLVVRETTKK